MKKSHSLGLLVAAGVAVGSMAQAQLVNLGLVGVGRLSADSFDQLGAGVDTLGGIFSGMWLDPATIVHSNGTIHATVYGLPDRGFGDGLQDFHPRVQRLAIAITPYSGPGPVAQDQIVIVNTDTHVLTVNGNTFTGFQPDDTNVVTHPQSLPGSLGGGKWSLDPEGIAFAPGGSLYISDEYGPFIYRFDSLGVLQTVLPLPDAFIPRIGTNYPRAINYLLGGLTTVATDSGRYNNRGMEGLSITPDGKKLVACLQSPLTQDGENRNPSRNVRILVYDIDPASPTYQQPLAEYIHVLPLSAAEANNRHTPVSEILAISDKRFLILQRDSRGLGGDAGALLYKRIVEVDASAASNILGTGYDLEKNAPGALALPRSGLPSNVVAVTSRDLVDILNRTQLARFGLNTAASNQNLNTLSEKWEALAIVPLNDPTAPNDYLLLVGNDNDFRAPVVYHNGQLVGTNTIYSDNMLLAFRIGADTTPPTIVCPAPRTLAARTNCTATVDLRAAATTSDNSAAPVTVSQSPSPTTPLGLGTHTITLVATDAAGNQSEPCTTTVTVTDQTGPVITTLSASPRELVPWGRRMLAVNLSVTASDNCDPNPQSEIINVTSNRPLRNHDDDGDNSVTADWVITGPLSVKLRAERSDDDERPRVYFITVQCTDAAGNASTATTTVRVRNRSNNIESGFLTSVKPYTLPVGPDYTIMPLLSVGDRVPRTGHPGLEYQMVGIPDGLGAYRNDDGTISVLMNHELGNTVTNEPRFGQGLDRGAVVSKYILAPDGSVLSGNRAYQNIFIDSVLYGPAPQNDNTTPGFARLCSASLSWHEAGFDRPIYFAGEESSGAITFDGRGGYLVAIFDNELHALSKFPRIPWENAIVRPHDGVLTVVMCMEDGPSSPDSQLYMYVGFKDRRRGATALARNGLDNGQVYAFAANSQTHSNEVSFQNGSIQGRWIRIPGAAGMTDVELEAASHAVGAFGFIRTEDGAFRPSNPNEYYFVTTGGAPGNMLGRLYRLKLNPLNLLGTATLSVIYNADEIIAAGGDIAVSPDNIDVSDDYIMICEDGTAPSRLAMAAKGRAGNIWRVDLRKNEAENIATLAPPGRDGIPVGPGVWETTGIIDASALMGDDIWLFNVQAHPPTGAPGRNTVEDGQLLLMIRNR